MIGEFDFTQTIYENPLSEEQAVRGFQLEGDGRITFPQARMRMENLRAPAEGQKANFVFWCPEDMPADFAVSWNFWPIREPGLCIFFFSAVARNGDSVLSSDLSRRTGEYEQYHHGEINAFHISYFRRRAPEERAFHTCNLRKSYGFHMVAQGADPLPSVSDAQPPYEILLVKCEGEIAFYVNRLPILKWTDDGRQFGPRLGGGKIGFRQMAPLIAEYADLKVTGVRKVDAHTDT